VKSLVAYLAFRAGMAILGILPATVANALGVLGGLAAYPFARGRRAMALRHARRAGGPGADAARACRRMFASYGRYWAEVLWVRPHRSRQVRSRMVVEGLDHVVEAQHRGAGIILALPHVGNWEVAGLIADEIGLELVAVAEDLPNRRIRDWFVRLRNQMHIEVVLAGGGLKVMRSLEETLRRGGAVALLSDRDLKGKGIPVTFFGEETTLPAGPALLARRTGAPILPVASYFRPRVGHHIVVEPPLALPPDGSRASWMSEATQRVADALERLIRRAPEQWHLFQPNWPSDREG